MLFNLWVHLSYLLKDFVFYLLLLLAAFISLIFCSFKIYKSQFSQKRKKILLSIVFSLFCLILIFSTFEAYFRYRYDDSDGLGFLKVNAKWHKRHIIFNSSAFRDRDFNPIKQEGVIRIGILGDSITEGDGIKKAENRFSNILEKKLLNAGYKVEVYNLGKAGYDFEAEVDVYNSVKYLDFDLIVWESFINDIQPKENSTGTPIIVKNSQKAKVLEAISNTSFFLDYLYWRFSSVYSNVITSLRSADVDQYKNPQRLETYKKEIADFSKALAKDHKKFTVIVFPSIALLGDRYPVFINDEMENNFKKNNIDYVSLYPYLKDQDSKGLKASRFDSHPNEKVHALAADKLFEKIKTVLDQK